MGAWSRRTHKLKDAMQKERYSEDGQYWKPTDWLCPIGSCPDHKAKISFSRKGFREHMLKQHKGQSFITTDPVPIWKRMFGR